MPADDPAPPVPPPLPTSAPAGRVDPARPRAPRLPGTYAANYETDMNWRRGVAVLWTLFILLALSETLYAAVYFLKGYAGYPGLVGGLRLCLEGAFFVALWLGWGWLRWPLAGMNFFYGAWLIVWLIGTHSPAPAQTDVPSPPPSYGIESIPILALATVSLASAAYVAFSADMLDFLRHRREDGRGWVVIPVILVVGAFVLSLLCSQIFYLTWMDFERESGRKFITESLRAMSSPWSAATYEALADREYLDTWYGGDRAQVFKSLAPLGAFQRADAPTTTGGSSEDAGRGGFQVHVNCDIPRVQFAHGDAHFGAEAVRTLFGPWKMRSFEAGEIHFNSAPPAVSP